MGNFISFERNGSRGPNHLNQIAAQFSSASMKVAKESAKAFEWEQNHCRPGNRFRLNWDSLTNGVTNNLMKTVEKAFYMFDVDKSGTISQWELQMVMRSLGCNPTEEQVLDMMNRADVDGSGSLDMHEFCRLMEELFGLSDDDPQESLLQAFRILHPNSKGLVKVQRMKDMLNNFNLDQTWSEDDTNEVIGYFEDEDMINFDEFVSMVMSNSNLE